MDKTDIEATESDTMTAPHHHHQKPSAEFFYTTIATHYAARSDAVSIYFFRQLGEDYSERKISDRDFYLAVYRHLYSSASLSLLPGFRDLLPPGWKDLDLEWMNRGIETDVDGERERSRRAVGELADGLMRFSESGSGVLAMVSGGDYGVGPATVVAGDKQKKKTPLKGFITSFSKTETPPSSNTPTHLEPNNHNSPSKANAPTPSSPHSTPKKKETATPQKKNPPTTTATPQKPSSPSPSRTTGAGETKAKTTPILLRTASSLPHPSPIYPTLRAILSRKSTKPYIHALCGQRFGHPAEVKRHHDGQSGRPGCWEKSGKPEGRAWDEDRSCKVKMQDLEYVRVKGGWVVTSWGGVDVEGVREGKLVGGDDGAEGLGGGGGGGEERKMIATKLKDEKKSKSQVKQEEGEASEASDEQSDTQSNEEDEDENKDGSFSDDELTPEPAAKRRKVVATENEKEASVVNAAARAAALGLRARK